MFRVSEIQETTEISNWRYIPSKLNTADLATKWVRTPKFKLKNPWFTGPQFLKLETNKWPVFNNTLRDHVPECQLVAVQKEQSVPVVNFTRFSKYERLFRCMAYADVCLKSEQLLWSEIYLLKLIQSQTYSFEKFLLKNPDCSLPKSSNIRKYSPFLNKNLVLRLRGRLENATIITDETKNPVLLPKSHYITHLLVDWYQQ